MYWGNYEDYLRARPEEATPSSLDRPEDKPRPPKPSKPQPTVSKNEAKRISEKLKKLEESIEETETAIDSLEGRMAVPGFYDDQAAASEIVGTHEKLKGKLEKFYEEWGALAEKKEKLTSK